MDLQIFHYHITSLFSPTLFFSFWRGYLQGVFFFYANTALFTEWCPTTWWKAQTQRTPRVKWLCCSHRLDRDDTQLDMSDFYLLPWAMLWYKFATFACKLLYICIFFSSWWWSLKANIFVSLLLWSSSNGSCFDQNNFKKACFTARRYGK